MDPIQCRVCNCISDWNGKTWICRADTSHVAVSESDLDRIVDVGGTCKADGHGVPHDKRTDCIEWKRPQ